MDETDTPEDDTPKPSGKKGLLIGFLLALIGGGGAFFAMYSGMLSGEAAPEEPVIEDHETPMADVAFVAVEPMLVALGDPGANRHLRFRAHLEVESAHSTSVERLMPRILDVLNTYLRAVEISELEDPRGLLRIRAQMLRRIQLVAGPGHVRDLLVTEFVLN